MIARTTVRRLERGGYYTTWRAGALLSRLETTRALMSNSKARIFWIAFGAVLGLFSGYAIACFDVLPTARLQRVALKIEDKLHLSKRPTRPEVSRSATRLETISSEWKQD